jgi:cytochrome oxidase assembly protein ShyY1
VANARFLLRPRWLLSHVLVLLLVIVMINLGFWQLRRLDERRARNELIEARMDQPVVEVEDVVAPADDDGGGDGDDDGGMADARFRRVAAVGTYEDGDTVVVRNRSQDGVAGAWLVTPLRLADEQRVGVLRGFVPLGDDGTPLPAEAPAGTVTVEGPVIDPESFDGTAPKDLAPLLAEDDVLAGLILAEVSSPGEPALDDGTGTGTGTMFAVPPPELSEGPHLSYAVQWFIFSAIAVIGYPLVLRRVVKRRGKEAGDQGDEGDDRQAAGGSGDDLDAELSHLLQQGG